MLLFVPCLERTQSCGTRGRGCASSIWLVIHLTPLQHRGAPNSWADPGERSHSEEGLHKLGRHTSPASCPRGSSGLADRRGCAHLARGLGRGEGGRPGGGETCCASTAATGPQRHHEELPVGSLCLLRLEVPEDQEPETGLHWGCKDLWQSGDPHLLCVCVPTCLHFLKIRSFPSSTRTHTRL